MTSPHRTRTIHKCGLSFQFLLLRQLRVKQILNDSSPTCQGLIHVANWLLHYQAPATVEWAFCFVLFLFAKHINVGRFYQ